MRALCFSMILALAPSAATATPAPRYGVDSPPMLELGTAVVQNRTLSVRCEGPARCRLVIEFDAVAAEATTIRAPYVGNDAVTMDGRAVQELALAAGQSAHVRIEAERDVRPRWHDDNPFFMLADPLWARHVLLAPRSSRMTTARYDAVGVRWEPFYEAAISGPLTVDAALDDEMMLSVDGQEVSGAAQVADGRVIDLSMRAPPQPEIEWVRPGGPVLSLGGIFDSTGVRFGGRLGYELGITDWMIVSGTIESDFERRAMLSLMLEGATPNMLFFIVLGVVSVSTGIGAVLELSPDGARGAVRFVSCIQAAAAGVQITADYFPEDGSVVASVMGRVSL